MEDFLGEIYDLFKSFYGEYLSYYLWGYDPITEAYTNPNIYNMVGLVTIIVSLIMVVLFYYIFSHPRLSKWWSWLITSGINALIALFVAYGVVETKRINGYIPDSLNEMISGAECWGFGIANIFVSIILFILLSLMLKWGSKDAKFVPF
jgi:hypothetical protein